jgi:ERAP1-like C-terminal domain
LLQPVAHRIGTAAQAGESPNVQSLRSRIWTALVRFHDPEALARAGLIFADGNGSIADQRAALDIVGQAADGSTFDALLGRARTVKDPQEKLRILRAMARATDPSLSARIVEIALGPDAPAGSADDARITQVRRDGERDMPADARRPVEAAVASIKLNEKVKAAALPDIDRWIAGQED